MLHAVSEDPKLQASITDEDQEKQSSSFLSPQSALDMPVKSNNEDIKENIMKRG
jgi:hypothetical protein